MAVVLKRTVHIWTKSTESSIWTCPTPKQRRCPRYNCHKCIFFLQHGIPERPMDYTWKQKCSYIRASIMLPKLVSQIAYIDLCMDDCFKASLCVPEVQKYICVCVHSLFQPNSWTGQWFLLILSWAGPQGVLQTDRQAAMAFSAAGSGEPGKWAVFYITWCYQEEVLQQYF